MVCRYDMVFYPGQEFTNVAGDLMKDLKTAGAKAQPSRQYIPQPLITGTSSTSGPPVPAAPTYAGARPSKALDDAVYSAAELLQGRGPDRRKIMLILSDGWNEPKLNHHTHDKVLEYLLRNNVSVYSVAAGDEGAKRKFAELADYSSKTGGDIYYATTSGEMEELYTRITEQARHDYTLAYAPAGEQEGDTYHAVRVSVGEGLSANTRKGYYTSSSGN